MRLFFIVLLLSVCVGATVMAQSDEEKEVANLKIDLLHQRYATIQAKANWLAREQVILVAENQELERTKKELKTELSKLYKCKKGFDLTVRKCVEEK